ncbi:MAG: cystathionine gamma-synthase family protein [Alphaproteobacteria bacterium]|nr:cystathionine gamma-synthase family protein [Alphaproteobacteria bacterium]
MTNYKKTHLGQHKLHPETQMMSYGYDPFMSEGSVKPPVFLTSTFSFKTAEDGAEFFDVATGRKPMPREHSGGLIYSRINHPNLEIIENRIALLEEGEACNIFSSGMAAIATAFLALLKPGDVIVQSSPLYGGTEVLIRNSLKEWGIGSVEFHNGLDSQEIESAMAKAAALGRVGAIFIETPGNPTNVLVDFVLVKSVLDKFEKQHGYRPISICDNTLFGPVFQKPLRYGIDLVCYSLTKYVGGHSDLVAGAVIGKKSLLEKIRCARIAFGSHLDPHSSWMIGRSLETLFLRMQRASDSAEKIADWMKKNFPQIKIFYPKFIENSAYQKTLKQQCTGFGSTFSFVLSGGRKEAFTFINALQIFKSAVSLGGTESLVCHPASTTHSSVAPELREGLGITESLVRLSIGLENPDDLIADLGSAFGEVI